LNDAGGDLEALVIGTSGFLEIVVPLSRAGRATDCLRRPTGL
jgi:hypothetical protein